MSDQKPPGYMPDNALENNIQKQYQDDWKEINEIRSSVLGSDQIEKQADRSHKLTAEILANSKNYIEEVSERLGKPAEQILEEIAMQISDVSEIITRIYTHLQTDYPIAKEVLTSMLSRISPHSLSAVKRYIEGSEREYTAGLSDQVKLRKQLDYIIEDIRERDEGEWDLDEQLAEEYASVKERLLNEIEGNYENLDLGRVSNFLESKKLPICEYLIVDKKQLDQAQKILAEAELSWLYQPEDRITSGAYIPALDLVIVVRDQEMEKYNGQIAIEALLVHELGHGALTPLKSTKGWGDFLNEAAVQMLAGEYTAKYPSLLKDKMHGLGGESLDNNTLSFTLPSDNPEKELELPLKYMLFTEDSYTLQSPSLPAWSVEQLCYKIPDLRLAFLETPINPEKIQSLMDQSYPGLFAELNKLPYTQGAFVKGYNMIDEKINF